ncbi:unnamed protein product [Protopolystoma xenopodis]|uniref:Condensin complex subunit 1 C-terminal domain-containing protein n=1 Tax=Protopolystoma xenopodis TaxID=117903 RepID=A0A448X4D2_9PLAT|nr:unnamed protein product [Protopolystoma xenopodis]
MVDSNWRIRHASVHLLGDLLYKISGQTGKGTTKTIDEDDTFGTEAVHQRILEKLSVERRDRVLAQLHIARSDPTQIVRQAAVHVWKVVVSNTPRTLREILPVLIRLLLSMLGSFHREQQQVRSHNFAHVII